MKRTPFKNRGKALKRTPFKAKTAPRTKKRSKVAKCHNKRKPKTDLKKLKEQLWELCKQITRIRHGMKCYTCGTPTDHPHTGHFISSSVCSVELRYDLANLRPQCFRCNIHLSGNWLEYEKHLKSDGVDVESLKQKNEATKGMMYDITWYRKKVDEYEFIHSQEQQKKSFGI